jgi:hypothetical protein
MGTLEDIRKVLQDFLSPEIRSLAVRLEELEKRMNERFDAAEKLSEYRFASLEATIKANHLAMLNALDLDRRILRLEVKERGTEKHA